MILFKGFLCGSQSFAVSRRSSQARLMGVICDANGVCHNSPGQRPGKSGKGFLMSAEGAIHPVMRQAVGLQPNHNVTVPRALPWAGMKQTFGLEPIDIQVQRFSRS
jgi:hypothetical protein